MDRPKAGPDDPKTWPSWTDVLGQEYRPGDIVAVAVINDRSPQLVIAEVVQINAVDSKGKLIGEWSTDGGDPELREAFYRLPWTDPQKHDARRAWEATRTRTFNRSCTVRARPVIDARGFYRTTSGERSVWSGGPTAIHDARAVTYQIPNNVVKVDKSRLGSILVQKDHEE